MSAPTVSVPASQAAFPLAASSWGEEEIAALHRVIASGHFTMGPEVAAFEDQFARYFGRRHAVMVNSGSSANLVAVGALFYRRERPLRRGMRVIVPALSWSTTYHPLQQYGLKLSFVDIERETLNIDTSRLDAALAPDTGALMAVSILGNPARLDLIRAFCDRHGLAFIEDNCESMDAELDGRKAGAFGDISTFSFFFSHHISTMEGGMALTDDAELADVMRALRAHGWTRDLPADSTIHERGANDHFEAYKFILPGYNVRPTELQGAVGQEQLRKLPAMTAQRRHNLARFTGSFGGDPRFIIQRETGSSSAFCFPIILAPDHDIDREQVFAALKEARIGFRIITGGCFLKHPVIRHYDYEVVGGGTPNADLAHERGFFVGNHPYDLTREIDLLRDVLDRACR